MEAERLLYILREIFWILMSYKMFGTIMFVPPFL